MSIFVRSWFRVWGFRTFGVRGSFSDVRGLDVGGPILDVGGFWTFGVFGHSGFGVSFLDVRGLDVGGPFLDVGGFRTFGVGGSFMAGQGWESR